MRDTLKLLDATVDELTEPIPYTWETDHGTIIHKSTPCLLDQLREAIEDPDKILTGAKPIIPESDKLRGPRS